MALNKTFLRLLAPSSSRCVSSFIDKKSQAEINKRKIKEKRRLTKNLTPEEVEDENIPTYTYAHTNKNPISRVYTWGLVSYGALGNPQLHVPKKKAKNPNLRATMDYPCRLSSMEMKNVRDVACGYGFSLFATSQDSRGHFYGTGINHQGQFGHHFDEKNTPLQILLQPVPVQLPGDQIKVKRLECGQAHTIALTTKGKVFSLGNNAFGQCGRPVIQNEDYFHSQVIHPVHIPLLEKNDVIIDIECGVNHSLFLSQNGKVYACGWSADGQTGLGHYNNQHSPELVKGDISGEKIVKIACSADNVLALNDKGEVFGWGNSEYNQFSMVTDEQQINLPVKLDLGPIGKVIDIASGGSICMVLNDQHDVWVWGYGILGQGPNVDHSAKPLLLPSTLFGKNEMNQDAITEKIFCGVHNNAAINSYGDLYIWGKNKGGSLGLGDHRNDQFFPFKVNMGGEVQKISLGIDHSIALCKPYI